MINKVDVHVITSMNPNRNAYMYLSYVNTNWHFKIKIQIT